MVRAAKYIDRHHMLFDGAFDNTTGWYSLTAGYAYGSNHIRGFKTLDDFILDHGPKYKELVVGINDVRYNTRRGQGFRHTLEGHLVYENWLATEFAYRDPSNWNIGYPSFSKIHESIGAYADVDQQYSWQLWTYGGPRNKPQASPLEKDAMQFMHNNRVSNDIRAEVWGISEVVDLAQGGAPLIMDILHPGNNTSFYAPPVYHYTEHTDGRKEHKLFYLNKRPSGTGNGYRFVEMTDEQAVGVSDHDYVPDWNDSTKYNGYNTLPNGDFLPSGDYQVLSVTYDEYSNTNGHQFFILYGDPNNRGTTTQLIRWSTNGGVLNTYTGLNNDNGDQLEFARAISYSRDHSLLYILTEPVYIDGSGNMSNTGGWSANSWGPRVMYFSRTTLDIGQGASPPNTLPNATWHFTIDDAWTGSGIDRTGWNYLTDALDIAVVGDRVLILGDSCNNPPGTQDRNYGMVWSFNRLDLTVQLDNSFMVMNEGSGKPTSITHWQDKYVFTCHEQLTDDRTDGGYMSDYYTTRGYVHPLEDYESETYSVQEIRSIVAGMIQNDTTTANGDSNGIQMDYNETAGTMLFSIYDDYLDSERLLPLAGNNDGVSEAYANGIRVVYNNQKHFTYELDESKVRAIVASMFGMGTGNTNNLNNGGQNSGDLGKYYTKIEITDQPNTGDADDYKLARASSELRVQFLREDAQDITGNMFTGNDETGITSTYSDINGKVNLTADDPAVAAHTEIANVFSGNTETGISLVYDDTVNKVTATVDSNWVQDRAAEILVDGTWYSVTYDDTNNEIQLSLDKTGAALDDNYIKDRVGEVLEGGVDTGIDITYDGANNVASFTIDERDMEVLISNWIVTSITNTYPVDGPGLVAEYFNGPHHLDLAVNKEWIEQVVGSMFVGNQETNVEAIYNQNTEKIDLAVTFPPQTEVTASTILNALDGLAGYGDEQILAVDTQSTPNTLYWASNVLPSDDELAVIIDPLVTSAFHDSDVAGVVIRQYIALALGEAVTGNTETGLTVSYDTGTAKLNFALSSEWIEEDIANYLVGGNGINVIWTDGADQYEFGVDNEFVWNLVKTYFDSNMSTSVVAAPDDNTRKVQLSVGPLPTSTVQGALIPLAHDNGDILTIGGADGNTIYFSAPGDIEANDGHIQSVVGQMFTDNQPNNVSTVFNVATRKIQVDVSDEQIQDSVGPMFDTSYQTGFNLWYNDADNRLVGNLDLTYVQNLVGAMFTGTPSTGLLFSYHDGPPGSVSAALDDNYITTHTINTAVTRDNVVGVLIDPSALGNGQVLKTAGAVGGGTPTDLIFAEDLDTNTQVSAEQIRAVAGGMFEGNQEQGVLTAYSTATGKVNLEVDFSITDINNAFLANLDGRPAGEYWLVLKKE